MGSFNHLCVESTFVVSVLWCRVWVRVSGRSRRPKAEASSIRTGLVDCFPIAWSGVVVALLTRGVVPILDFYGQTGFPAILGSGLRRVELCIRCGGGGSD